MSCFLSHHDCKLYRCHVFMYRYMYSHAACRSKNKHAAKRNLLNTHKCKTFKRWFQPIIEMADQTRACVPPASQPAPHSPSFVASQHHHSIHLTIIHSLRWRFNQPTSRPTGTTMNTGTCTLLGPRPSVGLANGQQLSNQSVAFFVGGKVSHGKFSNVIVAQGHFSPTTPTQNSRLY